MTMLAADPDFNTQAFNRPGLLRRLFRKILV